MRKDETPSAMYNELVKAIVKKVPEIQGTIPAIENFVEHKDITFQRRPITLEDVLRSCVDLGTSRISSNTVMLWIDDMSGGDIPETEWLLGKPLSEQSPETISFLHSLLCKL